MRYFNAYDMAKQAEKEIDRDIKEAKKRVLYGKYKGYWQWDLAVNWFQMSNDGFHSLYGFNFVPRGRLFTEAKDFVHSN